jgi:AraC-like DNA-binding protein
MMRRFTVCGLLALASTAQAQVPADELSVSERHLRRVFREVVGLSPKMFFKLVRFERALKAAKASCDSSWSNIAMSAGYYDQAHMIADFRSIAGATPRQFLAELRSQS